MCENGTISFHCILFASITPSLFTAEFIFRKGTGPQYQGFSEAFSGGFFTSLHHNLTVEGRLVFTFTHVCSHSTVTFYIYVNITCIINRFCGLIVYNLKHIPQYHNSLGKCV